MNRRTAKEKKKQLRAHQSETDYKQHKDQNFIKKWMNGYKTTEKKQHNS